MATLQELLCGDSRLPNKDKKKLSKIVKYYKKETIEFGKEISKVLEKRSKNSKE